MNRRSLFTTLILSLLVIALGVALGLVYHQFDEEYILYAYARNLIHLVTGVYVTIGAILVIHVILEVGKEVKGWEIEESAMKGRLGLILGITSLVGIVSAVFFVIPFLWRDYAWVKNDFGSTLTLATDILVFGGLGWLGFTAIWGFQRFYNSYSTGIGTISPERQVKPDRDNIPGTRRLVRYATTRNFQVAGLLTIIVVAAVPGIIGATAESCNFTIPMGFSDPAYALPSGAHYNTALDDANKVNQTVLASIEKGLWALPKIRQAGGFPMYVMVDGSQYASDRGFGCPLFPREFSLQGGTALLAGLFLQMYAIEPNPIYLQVATSAADALVTVQDDLNGGFYYEGRRYSNGQGYQPHPLNGRRAAILDDDVMQSAMRFLLDVYAVTKNETYLAAVKKGFDCLEAIEKPGGGWPQRSNYPDDAYQSLVTLNDDALQDVFFLMLKAARMFPDEARYMEAATRACLFLVRVQGNGGADYQTGWAQQYKDDQPAWARTFEPAAMCSSQTSAAMECLLEMYLETGNRSWLEPIPAGITWLEHPDTILNYDNDGDPVYARLYELGTNKPIYGIAGGQHNPPGEQYVYKFEEARPGYSWQGNYGITGFIRDYKKLVELNYDITAFEAWRTGTPNLGSALENAWAKVQAQQDSGFWYGDSDGKTVIRDSTYASACQGIMNYLRIAIA